MKMKNLFRITALILVLAQLFVITAFAAGTAPKKALDKMNAARTAVTAKSSGAAEGSAAAVNAENEKKAKEAKAAEEAAAAAKKAAAGKVDYEIAPATDLGMAGDVMIGGLAIHPGVWYTVKDGVLTSSEPWPDSYLYYSASQSKITLHEFHYRVSGQTSGKEDTFAALYIPKDMHIILEGENELINGSFTKAGGGMSNGVYAPNCVITFEGDGVLKVNTLVDGSLKGYGIGAGNIRIDSKFTGLAVFGMTSAFSSAPSIQGSHKMLANVADLHPEYYGDVRVKEASPYDKSIFTRFRYVLLAVGDEISPQQEMREQIEAEYYRSKMEYNEAVEAGYAEAFETYNNEVSNSLMNFGMAMDQEMNAINSQEFGFDASSWEDNSAGSQLLDMLMGAVG
jgi:hypothetical protein